MAFLSACPWLGTEWCGRCLREGHCVRLPPDPARAGQGELWESPAAPGRLWVLEGWWWRPIGRIVGGERP